MELIRKLEKQAESWSRYHEAKRQGKTGRSLGAFKGWTTRRGKAVAQTLEAMKQARKAKASPRFEEVKELTSQAIQEVRTEEQTSTNVKSEGVAVVAFFVALYLMGSIIPKLFQPVHLGASFCVFMLSSHWVTAFPLLLCHLPELIGWPVKIRELVGSNFEAASDILGLSNSSNVRDATASASSSNSLAMCFLPSFLAISWIALSFAIASALTLSNFSTL